MTNPEGLWDKRYSENSTPNAPSEFLEVFEQYLPHGGTCVDIAGGNGRNALWFAKKGYVTSVVDISTVALNQALKSAEKQDVELECIHWDIEENLMPRSANGILLCSLFS